jgi:1,4-dihydroxy-2-naphthoate octaprenyltransferase
MNGGTILLETARDILRMGRPGLVFGASLLYLAGALLAVLLGAGVSIDRFLLGYLIFITALLSIPFGNDYFDAATDVLGESTPYSGGTGVLLRNPGLKRFAFTFSLAMVFVSISLAIAYVLVFPSTMERSALFLSYVVGSNALAWSYSAPPVRLGFRGLGEPATAAGIGFLTPGMGYLAMAGGLDQNFLLFSVPLLCYGAGFILSVQMPDIEADLRAGKNTLVSRKGRRFAAAAIAALFLVASGSFTVLSLSGLIAGIDLRPVAAFSVLPAFFGVRGLLRPPADRPDSAATMNTHVVSMMALVLFTDVYFVLLARGTDFS